MNAGKVLIGMAMLVFSVALLVSPSGAAPDTHLPFGQAVASGADTTETGVSFLTTEGLVCGQREAAAVSEPLIPLHSDPAVRRVLVLPAMRCR